MDFNGSCRIPGPIPNTQKPWRRREYSLKCKKIWRKPHHHSLQVVNQALQFRRTSLQLRGNTRSTRTLLSLGAVYVNCCLPYAVCRGVALCTTLVVDKFSKKGKAKVAGYQHCPYCTGPAAEKNTAIYSFCTVTWQSCLLRIYISPPWLLVVHQLTYRQRDETLFSPVCQYAFGGPKRHCLILVSPAYTLLHLP